MSAPEAQPLAKVLYLRIFEVRCPACEGRGHPSISLGGLFDCEACEGRGLVPFAKAQRLKSPAR